MSNSHVEITISFRADTERLAEAYDAFEQAVVDLGYWDNGIESDITISNILVNGN